MVRPVGVRTAAVLDLRPPSGAVPWGAAQKPALCMWGEALGGDFPRWRRARWPAVVATRRLCGTLASLLLLPVVNHALAVAVCVCVCVSVIGCVHDGVWVCCVPHRGLQRLQKCGTVMCVCWNGVWTAGNSAHCLRRGCVATHSLVIVVACVCTWVWAGAGCWPEGGEGAVVTALFDTSRFTGRGGSNLLRPASTHARSTAVSLCAACNTATPGWWDEVTSVVGWEWTPCPPPPPPTHTPHTVWLQRACGAGCARCVEQPWWRRQPCSYAQH
jgi:hypothetical protein